MWDERGRAVEPMQGEGTPDLPRDVALWLQKSARIATSEEPQEGYYLCPEDGGLEAARNELAASAARILQDVALDEVHASTDHRQCTEQISMCLKHLRDAHGDWSAADKRWRRLYGHGCTLQAVWMSRNVLLRRPGAMRSESDDCRGALRLIDMGMLAEKDHHVEWWKTPERDNEEWHLRSRIAAALHARLERAAKVAASLLAIEVSPGGSDSDENDEIRTSPKMTTGKSSSSLPDPANGSSSTTEHLGSAPDTDEFRASSPGVRRRREQPGKSLTSEEELDQMEWCAAGAWFHGAGERRRRIGLIDFGDIPTKTCGSCSPENPSCVLAMMASRPHSLPEHGIGGGACFPLVKEAEMDGHVHSQTPCIVEGLAGGWRALDRWTSLSYIRSVAGLRTVPVEMGRYNDSQCESRIMTLNGFIDECILRKEKQEPTNVVTRTQSFPSPNSSFPSDLPAPVKEPAYDRTPPGRTMTMGYMAQHDIFQQVSELRGDITVPDVCFRTGLGKVNKINAWFGPAGTVSPLHTDRYDNVLVQVVGAKYIRIYSPQYSHHLRPGKGELSNTSSIDLASPELKVVDGPLGEAAGLPFFEGVLKRGQAIFIPAGHWHYVRSLTPSLSVNVWWE